MPHHFAKLYSNHTQTQKEREIEQRIEKRIGLICGTLYSVITLKAFFPKSPAKNVDQAQGDVSKD